MVRFKTPTAFPPTGQYEYAVGDELVVSKSAADIAAKAAALRRKNGLPVIGNPFAYVMDYMCPKLPDGFCSKPSAVKSIHAADVKRRTAALFGLQTVPVDEVERRMTVCLACPKHVTRGFCMGCSGLIDWIYRGFGGRRGRLPPDQATGVCSCSLELVAASASVGRPAAADDYPDTCWRKTEV